MLAIGYMLIIFTILSQNLIHGNNVLISPFNVTGSTIDTEYTECGWAQNLDCQEFCTEKPHYCETYVCRWYEERFYKFVCICFKQDTIGKPVEKKEKTEGKKEKVVSKVENVQHIKTKKPQKPVKEKTEPPKRKTVKVKLETKFTKLKPTVKHIKETLTIKTQKQKMTTLMTKRVKEKLTTEQKTKQTTIKPTQNVKEHTKPTTLQTKKLQTTISTIMPTKKTTLPQTQKIKINKNTKTMKKILTTKIDLQLTKINKNKQTIKEDKHTKRIKLITTEKLKTQKPIDITTQEPQEIDDQHHKHHHDATKEMSKVHVDTHKHLDDKDDAKINEIKHHHSLNSKDVEHKKDDDKIFTKNEYVHVKDDVHKHKKTTEKDVDVKDKEEKKIHENHEVEEKDTTKQVKKTYDKNSVKMEHKDIPIQTTIPGKFVKQTVGITLPSGTKAVTLLKTIATNKKQPKITDDIKKDSHTEKPAEEVIAETITEKSNTKDNFDVKKIADSFSLKGMSKNLMDNIYDNTLGRLLKKKSSSEKKHDTCETCKIHDTIIKHQQSLITSTSETQTTLNEITTDKNLHTNSSANKIDVKTTTSNQHISTKATTQSTSIKLHTSPSLSTTQQTFKTKPTKVTNKVTKKVTTQPNITTKHSIITNVDETSHHESINTTHSGHILHEEQLQKPKHEKTVTYESTTRDNLITTIGSHDDNHTVHEHKTQNKERVTTNKYEPTSNHDHTTHTTDFEHIDNATEHFIHQNVDAHNDTDLMHDIHKQTTDTHHEKNEVTTHTNTHNEITTTTPQLETTEFTTTTEYTTEYSYNNRVRPNYYAMSSTTSYYAQTSPTTQAYHHHRRHHRHHRRHHTTQYNPYGAYSTTTMNYYGRTTGYSFNSWQRPTTQETTTESYSTSTTLQPTQTTTVINHDTSTIKLLENTPPIAVTLPMEDLLSRKDTDQHGLNIADKEKSSHNRSAMKHRHHMRQHSSHANEMYFDHDEDPIKRIGKLHKAWSMIYNSWFMQKVIDTFKSVTEFICTRIKSTMWNVIHEKIGQHFKSNEEQVNEEGVGEEQVVEEPEEVNVDEEQDGNEEVFMIEPKDQDLEIDAPVDADAG